MSTKVSPYSVHKVYNNLNDQMTLTDLQKPMLAISRQVSTKVTLSHTDKVMFRPASQVTSSRNKQLKFKTLEVDNSEPHKNFRLNKVPTVRKQASTRYLASDEPVVPELKSLSRG